MCGIIIIVARDGGKHADRGKQRLRGKGAKGRKEGSHGTGDRSVVLFGRRYKWYSMMEATDWRRPKKRDELHPRGNSRSNEHAAFEIFNLQAGACYVRV